MKALTHEAYGNREEALKALSRALTLAEPQGHVRTFINEGQSVKDLLVVAKDTGIAPKYARRLLSVFAGAPGDTPQLSDGSPPQAQEMPQSLIEPLSPRELEILELVAQGLSNREISERLFLSISTVKGHNSNIFGKLQVDRRTGAVARARELNLL